MVKVHGVPAPAAAQRRVVMSQYFASPHSELLVQGSPTWGGPHVPARLAPPSVTTTRFRQASLPFVHCRALLQAPPVITRVTGWQVRTTSSHRSSSLQPGRSGSHGAPTAPGGVHRPLRHGAVSTQSSKLTQLLPAGRRAVHSPAPQRKGSTHSVFLVHAAPDARFARQTRVLSQKASGTHWKFGHA